MKVNALDVVSDAVACDVIHVGARKHVFGVRHDPTNFYTTYIQHTYIHTYNIRMVLEHGYRKMSLHELLPFLFSFSFLKPVNVRYTNV